MVESLLDNSSVLIACQDYSNAYQTAEETSLVLYIFKTALLQMIRVLKNAVIYMKIKQ